MSADVSETVLNPLSESHSGTTPADVRHSSLKTPPCLPELLNVEQVAHRLSMSVRTVWRLVACGKFPQPVRYNRKLVRWKSADISRYVESLE